MGKLNVREFYIILVILGCLPISRCTKLESLSDNPNSVRLIRTIVNYARGSKFFVKLNKALNIPLPFIIEGRNYYILIGSIRRIDVAIT